MNYSTNGYYPNTRVHSTLPQTPPTPRTPSPGLAYRQAQRAGGIAISTKGRPLGRGQLAPTCLFPIRERSDSIAAEGSYTPARPGSLPSSIQQNSMSMWWNQPEQTLFSGIPKSPNFAGLHADEQRRLPESFDSDEEPVYLDEEEDEYEEEGEDEDNFSSPANHSMYPSQQAPQSPAYWNGLNQSWPRAPMGPRREAAVPPMALCRKDPVCNFDFASQREASRTPIARNMMRSPAQSNQGCITDRRSF